MQFPVCPELTRKNGLATLHRNQTHPNVLNDRGRLFKPTEPLLSAEVVFMNRLTFPLAAKLGNWLPAFQKTPIRKW